MTLNHSQQITVGFMIGQIIIMTIKVFRLQRTKAELNYWDAVKIVFFKGLGTFFVALAGLSAVLYTFPEFFKNVMILDEAGKSSSWMQNIVTWIRASSIAFGLVAQTIVMGVAGNLEKTTQRYIDSKFDKQNENE